MKHLILLLLMTAYMSVTAQDTVRITDYGYIPGSRANAVPYVTEALKACRLKSNPVLFFPTGRYDFWPQYVQEKTYYESNTDVINARKCPILIENFNKLELNGNYADFIFHDRMQPFTIDSSSNITLRNINIDWDIPLTAQARVATVTDNYTDIQVNTCESPYVIERGKLFFTGGE